MSNSESADIHSFGTGIGQVHHIIRTAPPALRATPDQVLAPAIVSAGVLFRTILGEAKDHLANAGPIPGGHKVWLSHVITPGGVMYLRCTYLLDGAPVAAARVQLTTPVPKWGTLEVETDPEHRGRGYATRVLKELTDWWPVDLGHQVYTTPAARAVAAAAARRVPLVTSEALRGLAVVRFRSDTRPDVWPPPEATILTGPGIDMFLAEAGAERMGGGRR